MKKIVLLLGLMFALQTQIALMAQQTTGDVVFNAHLLTTFNLNVDGNAQEITFANADDYNNGVVEAVGILPGITAISVEATQDWYLTIECPDFLPGGGPLPGTGFIPIENLGVTITEDGAHGLATGEVVYTAIAPLDPQGLTNAVANLIWKGANSDAGDISDNSFTLHWEMGTQLGTMYALGSMFDQMAATVPNFTTGDFTTTAILTLVPNP